MNASAIYSKSGKGVQEASGKTSHLSRSDRAVLAAIDGRATLADVAQKVGKTFDPAFEKLIESLDKGGFIREVSAGVAALAGGAKPAAASGKPAAAPVDPASDVDFTTALSVPRGKPAPRASKTQPTHTAPVPPPPPPPSAAEKVQAAKSAQEQQDAFARAREEAERKAAAERERVKAEAEARMRAEAEVKMRAEAEARLKAQAEAKAKADAEAKIKAAQETAAKAAAEAKAKAEAEARKAREEAERARKEAAEIAERARKEAAEIAERARREAEEKARREQEELKRKLEEERRAREEAERRAAEERKAREEEKRREDEERAQRRIQEERERQARRRQEREEEEEEDRPRRKKKEVEPEQAPPPAQATPAAGAFSDTLLADLESFTTRDDDAQKEREEAARKEKEAAAVLAREAEERRVKEEAERTEREAKQRRKEEEAERRARDEAELREREEREKQRLKDEEEKRRKEAEEREKKAKQEEQLAAKATRASGAAYDVEMRAKRERDLKSRSRATAARAERKSWGRPIAIALFVLVVIALGVAHVMPIDTVDYERAASEALGRPVKIGAARLSLFTGLQVKLSDVRIGEGIILPDVRAYPEYDALLGPRKAFSRIELERLKLEQEALGQVLFFKLKGDNLSVGRLVARNVELTGPLVLPKGLEFELAYDGAGVVRSAVVRGPDALLARLSAKGQALEFDMSAASFTLPFAPEISLSTFSAKGTASAQGLQVNEWDGALLNGQVSGTASVRWGESWAVDGVVTARNINAAVFAPALLSDGKGEGSGKFSMRGAPGKLAATSRLDGSFTVTRGVLGSIDLSRAIQTGGKQATGRTQFNEMNGQAIYERGAVTLRNITIGAGQLNAGASADIAQNGALSGRIVADVKVAQQRLSATLNLGGTVKEPQVRN